MIKVPKSSKKVNIFTIAIISFKGQETNDTRSDPSSSWINLDDKSYFVSTEKKNIKDAKADCISKASKLFEPKNAKHNTFIAHLSERKGLSEFWVGIHHRKENEAEGKDLFEGCYNLNPFLATLQLGSPG